MVLAGLMLEQMLRKELHSQKNVSLWPRSKGITVPPLPSEYNLCCLFTQGVSGV